MSIIPSLPVTLQNGTTADATQVMANFNSIVANVNNNAANGGVNSNITSLAGLTTPLSAAQGGSGVASPTANCVLVSNGSGAFTPVGPGVAGTVLTSNGSGLNPTFGCPYAVGDLYLTTNATNPSTKYAGTTWSAYAAGLAIIGVGSYTDGNGTSQTFTGGGVQGEYLHTLTPDELATHAHTINDPGHSHYVQDTNGGGGSTPLQYARGGLQENVNTSTSTTGISINNTGSNDAHNNVQPSIGVYIWLRTA